MVNVVNIIDSLVRIYSLAFSSNKCSDEVQPHRAAKMARDSYFFIYFDLKAPCLPAGIPWHHYSMEKGGRLEVCSHTNSSVASQGCGAAPPRPISCFSAHVPSHTATS